MESFKENAVLVWLRHDICLSMSKTCKCGIYSDTCKPLWHHIACNVLPRNHRSFGRQLRLLPVTAQTHELLSQQACATPSGLSSTIHVRRMLHCDRLPSGVVSGLRPAGTLACPIEQSDWLLQPIFLLGFVMFALINVLEIAGVRLRYWTVQSSDKKSNSPFQSSPIVKMST